VQSAPSLSVEQKNAPSSLETLEPDFFICTLRLLLLCSLLFTSLPPLPPLLLRLVHSVSTLHPTSITMFSTLIFALSAVAVSAAPIQPRSTELLLPNATQTGVDAVWYKMNGNNGACGHSDSDSDKVVGLPLEFYTDLSSVSPYCGQYVVVTNPNNNVSVT